MLTERVKKGCAVAPDFMIGVTMDTFEYCKVLICRCSVTMDTYEHLKHIMYAPVVTRDVH